MKNKNNKNHIINLKETKTKEKFTFNKNIINNEKKLNVMDYLDIHIDTSTNKKKYNNNRKRKYQNDNGSSHYHIIDTYDSIPMDVYKLNKKLNEMDVPWVPSKDGYLNRNMFIRLHEEIIDFTNYISPTKIELQNRKIVFKSVKTIMKNVLLPYDKDTIQIVTFGSQSTGLFLPISDIDIVILIDNGLNNMLQDDKNRKRTLQQLTSVLRTYNHGEFATDITCIINTRVPIIKFKHKDTGLNVDISFNVSSGLETATLVKGFISAYPAFRPLVLFLKYFLSQRKLNDTYTGGVGSYLLQLMVVAYLQYVSRNQYHEINKNILNDCNSLGHLLFGFFEFYGSKFNYRKLGISVKHNGYFFNKEDRDWDIAPVNIGEERDYLLCIENPHEPNVDTGKNSYEIRLVSRIFNHAFTVLKREMYRRSDNVEKTRNRRSILCKLIKIDDVLKKRKDEIKVGFDKVNYGTNLLKNILNEYEEKLAIQEYDRVSLTCEKNRKRDRDLLDTYEKLL